MWCWWLSGKLNGLEEVGKWYGWVEIKEVGEGFVKIGD